MLREANSRRHPRARQPSRLETRLITGLTTGLTTGLITALITGLPPLLTPGPALAQGRSVPPPPKAPVTIYRPDQATCQADNLLGAYSSQLQQFAGQSQRVLIRLRQLQLELAEASLKTCANQNLLSRQEADRIWRELQAMPLPQAGSAAAGQRP